MFNAIDFGLVLRQHRVTHGCTHALVLGTVERIKQRVIKTRAIRRAGTSGCASYAICPSDLLMSRLPNSYASTALADNLALE